MRGVLVVVVCFALLPLLANMLAAASPIGANSTSMRYLSPKAEILLGAQILLQEDPDVSKEVESEEPQVIGATERSDTAMISLGFDKLVIFGGKDKNKKLLNDVWAFDLNHNTWQELTVEGGERPPGRCWHELSSGKPDFSKMYLFGGFDGKNDLNDLWRYSFANGLWLQIRPAGPSPLPRDRHSMVWYKNTLVVFGGYVGTYVSDMWSYSIAQNQWTEMHFISGPSKRRSHSAAVGNDKMWIFGGYDGERYFSDLWEFDFLTNVWTELRGKIRPFKRAASRLVADGSGTLFLFGGFDGSEHKGDLWSHKDSEGWKKVDAEFERPAERSAFSMTFQKSDKSVDKGRVYIFGGKRSETEKASDLFKYELATNQWRQLVVIPPDQ